MMPTNGGRHDVIRSQESEPKTMKKGECKDLGVEILAENKERTMNLEEMSGA